MPDRRFALITSRTRIAATSDVCRETRTALLQTRKAVELAVEKCLQGRRRAAPAFGIYARAGIGTDATANSPERLN